MAPARFAPTVPHTAPAPSPAPPGMVWIPGGEFSMGSEAAADALCDHPGITRDAQPIHRVAVDGFWMDATEVTNEQFAAFVNATAYVTAAEQPPNPSEFPGVPREFLVPGSTLFTPPDKLVDLGDARQWWRYEAGADWRHPLGSGSDLRGREHHPVGAPGLRRRRRLCGVGRTSAAHRGGVGICRAWWIGWTTLRVGQRAHA